MMDDFDELTPAQKIAYLAESPRTQEPEEVFRSVSYRVPASLLVHIDALAQLTGYSRNSMMTSLLRVGYQAVRSEMADTSHLDDLIDAITDSNEE
jgi:hypothetical protein